MKTVPDSLEGKLVVSCQALENESLYGSPIMSHMAPVAAQSGTVGIRANSTADTNAVKEIVSLPMIGIVKRDYPDSEVFITATLRGVDELMTAEPETIALDITTRPRPGGQTLKELVTQIRVRYPSVLLMADVVTIEEAMTVEHLGSGYVGTTFYGYTAEIARHVLAENDCGLLREALAAVSASIVAEGNVDTPEHAACCLTLGAHTAVVEGTIARSQQIATRFITAIAS